MPEQWIEKSLHTDTDTPASWSMGKFRFIVKTAKSSSLSHGTKEEDYRIRCHAQSWRRIGSQVPSNSQNAKTIERSKVAASHKSPAVTSEQLQSVDIIDSNARSRGTPCVQSSCWVRSVQHVAPAGIKETSFTPRAVIGRCGIDPFSTTKLPKDASGLQIFAFMFQDFTNENFRAEALGKPAKLIRTAFRHVGALEKRRDSALCNDMIMSTTLAFASAAMGWRFGIHYSDRPPEYYIQKGCREVRKRLQTSATVDNDLIMSVYALAAAEMWLQHFDTSRTHAKVVNLMIQLMGGSQNISPYVMESIILGFKFLAIFSMSTPLVELDWDPPPWSVARWAAVQARLPPDMQTLGTSFFDQKNSAVVGHWHQAILIDMIALLHASYYVYNIQVRPRREDEGWLYLKTQAVSHRLLTKPGASSTSFQESLRIALLIWLLSITDYMGSRIAAVETLQHLQEAQDAVEHVSVMPEDLLDLAFWINSVGAMVELGSEVRGRWRSPIHKRDRPREFFSLRTLDIAKRMNLKSKKDKYREKLQGFLYLEDRQGTQLGS